MARLATNATTCGTGTPTGGTGSQVQIRFGFVPYATNVNVGKLLPTSWFVDSHNYQTRALASTPFTFPNPGTPTVTGTTYSWNTPANNAWTDKQTNKSGTSVSWCQNNVPADTTPTNGTQGSSYGSITTPGPGADKQTVTYKRDTPVTKYTYRYDSFTSNKCYYDRAQVSGTKTDSYSRVDTGVANWTYDSLPVNVGLLKNGTSWKDNFQWPIADAAAMRRSTGMAASRSAPPPSPPISIRSRRPPRISTSI